MNRDILSKAKRIDNGEWIEGYYAVIGERKVIIAHPEMFYTEDAKESYGNEIKDVDPSTVCWHTGKEYMDCEAAYEGDIFESQVDGTRMVLRFGTYQAYCPVDKSFMDSVGFYAECPGLPDMPIGDLKDYALKVGNIFDNPELLF